MAHAWKACWVQALRGSNPLSSAAEEFGHWLPVCVRGGDLMKNSGIPPIIWMYWDEGLEQAPEVVQFCEYSWRLLNPEYKVRVLEKATYEQYVGLDSTGPDLGTLPVQQFTDVLRLELLKKNGGIWVDATLFCTKPLRDWLDPDHRSGVYLVDVPSSTDKFFDNFFIASRKGGKFVSRWLRLYLRYLSSNPKPMSHQLTKRLLKTVPGLRLKLGRIAFTSAYLRDRFGFPYFIVQYLGTRLLVSSPGSLLLWLRRDKVQPGKFSSLLRVENPNVQLEQDLKARRFPFIKLTHKALPDQVERLEAVMKVLRAWLARQAKVS